MRHFYIKKWGIVLFGLIASFHALSQTTAPKLLGYVAGQSKLHSNAVKGDTFRVSFSGGAAVGGKHITALAPPAGSFCMAGFKYGVLYAPVTFDKDMFVSKGYFPDYVQLTWEVIRYQNQITAFKVFRRELGSNAAFLQVANLSSSATSWKDEFAESGVMYEYKLFADGLFPTEQSFLNILTGIGFRIPSGTVSGRVTYAGGGAVQGASLIAETEDNFNGTSLKFNGTSSYLAVSPPADHNHFKFTNKFTFQAWLKPTSTVTSTIFDKNGQYKITHSSGNITFTAGATSVSLPFTQKTNEFFQVTAVRAADSLHVYVMYDDATIYKKSVAFSGATAANNAEIIMGKNTANTQYYNGIMDEVRIWYRALPYDEVITKSFMYIAGTEDSLASYHRMNEGVGTNFYDLSRKGFNFNEKHGFMSNVTWSVEIPTRTQLSVKGLTDVNGNYLISGIPYTSDGSTYRIVPAFGVHSFDPTERLMFIGPGSNVYSDVNFTDVASFYVSGRVFYKDTKVPVSGVNLKIDGQTAAKSDGNLVTSDVNGDFKIDVPIGKHRLQLVKIGHVFEGGGFFPDSLSKYDFQQPFTIQTNFSDNTLIKVVGKVVGGPVEGAKSEGMARSINNIGNATITLTTEKGLDLKVKTGDTTGTWDNRYYDHKVGQKTYGTTGYSITELKPTEIEIRPEATTGEYYAYLLPERYIVKGITAGTYTFDASFSTVLDLTSFYSQKTVTDSIQNLTETIIKPNKDDPTKKDTTYAQFYDSVRVHTTKDFIYRENPTVTLTSAVATQGDRFWEDKMKAKDGTELTIVSSNNFGEWLTPAPVFVQLKEYKTKIKVFEQYINSDNGNKIDNVPVIDGKINIQNDLAIDSKSNVYKLTKQGTYDYTFRGGLPNIATGGIGSFQKTMSVKVFTGTDGSIITDWPMNGSGFKGYIFGGMPTGNNFVTTGPNVIDMIIRDPQGTNSYAYYETGVSNSTETSYEVANGETVSAVVEIALGVEVNIFAGVGVGTITETEVTNDLQIGIEQSTNFIDNETAVTTTSNTQIWSTSAEPDFVGANGDVFIGKSTNIVYGKNIVIDLLPNSQCDANSKCVNLGGTLPTYNIGISEAVRISPKFNTGFQYTQNHIEYYLIPQLAQLRDIYYLNRRNKSVGGGKMEYECVFCSGSDYASNNTNQTSATYRIANNKGINGNSYKINYPALTPGVEYVDSVAWYNNQIKSWQAALARNEKEKTESVLVTNYSYDAGVIFESSTTIEDSETRTETFEFAINPSLATNNGFEVSGVGIETNITATYNHSETKSTTTGKTTSQTFGYVLNDGDEGDFYSIDVRDAQTGTGPVFKVRGGQSQCPYVNKEVSKYYNPGTVLSEATMKREVPQIAVSKAIVTGIPQGDKANFNLQLSNVSETNDGAWYQLAIDESTITGGAISLDGSGGNTFYLPAGTTINKILSIEQVVSDSFNFKNVNIVLQSLCQFDPSDNWEDISDTVQITAGFQPACSKVVLTDPNDLWLINSSYIQANEATPLAIGIGGYNLNRATFDKINVQYKPSSSSQWITDMVYYTKLADYNAATNPKAFVNGQTNLAYTFETKSLQDRNYDIRLLSVCSDQTEYASDIVSGIKDVKRPKLFGTPQPGDGILSPGDDIAVTFDEDIQQGLLTSFNFDIKGVLNGSDIAHNSVLFYDGTDDYASVLEGPSLSDKSFTVEFWTKRLSTAKNEVVFAQGDLEIGFNAANQLYTKLGTQTTTSAATYPADDTWAHYAIAYDYSTQKVSAYRNDLIAIDNVAVASEFNANGKIFFGSDISGLKNFNGYIHDMRVWEAARGQGSVVSNMNKTQSGDQVGLTGLWPMDEAVGALAKDLSRNHHALLHGAAWVVFPRGYARVLGGNDYLTIPSGDVVVTKEMDMTIEFWMKGSAQTNTVLFSNGKGDGTDPSPKKENIWVIGADNTGKLYAANNGTNLTISKDIFDNEWHHVALVLKRIANAAIYIDGSQEVFKQASNFGGFASPQMTLGAAQFRSGTTYTYSNKFTGSIDEFRFWKLAKTNKLIELDMSSKLKGDEIGLMTYFPFDAYDVNLVIQSSLNDQVAESNKIVTAVGGSADNTNVPNIKDARPVQKVAYNWVVNGDQLILNIDESPELVERTVLEITVRDVQDLNENRLASPITWTAYFKKNTVLWNENLLSFEKALYQEVSFDVDVLNLGGTEQNYEITNIPGWLAIDEPTGTLQPDSKKTLHFVIDQNTNIGNYEQSIFLGSDFGFKEKLEIKLKVKGDAPAWEVEKANFEYNMSVIGVLKINDIISINPDDKIAAFVNGELRGVANLKYIEAYDQYEFFLDIYSDELDGENIEFKVWNASEGKIQVDVIPNVAFENNSVVGDPSTPIIFVVEDRNLLQYNMKKGWNWISFNVNSTSLANSRTLLKDLTNADGDLVKGVSKYDQFGAGIGWLGSISSQGGFNLNSCYKLKLAKADTFFVVGESVDPSTISIPLVKGWNWVGYPVDMIMDINDALGNVNFAKGDFIKSQSGFALYDINLGWIGSLKAMTPTQGYMLKVGSSTNLTYLDPATLFRARKGVAVRTLASPWAFSVNDYQYNMSITAETDICKTVLGANDLIGVFVNNSCRGFIEPTFIESSNKNIFFLPASSNTPGETMKFKFYDSESNTIFDMKESLKFTNDTIVGGLDTPYKMTVNATNICTISAVSELNAPKLKIYPNPFNDLVSIEVLEDLESGLIEVTDMSGKLVRQLEVKESKATWNGLDQSGTEMTTGMYVFSITLNDAVYQVKVLKHK